MLRLSYRALLKVASANAAAASFSANKIRYVASDMDGTMLSPHHTLSDYTKETLRVINQDLKVPFIFATGRIHSDVQVVSKHLVQYFKEMAPSTKEGSGDRNDSSESKLASEVYAITSNGAVIHNVMTEELISERCIPPELARELYALLPVSETRINTNIIQNGKWYCRLNWEEMLQFHQESGITFDVLEKIPDRATTQPSDNSTEASVADGYDGRVVKLSFTSWDKPLLDRLEQQLVHVYGGRLTINYSASYCVDITAKGVTKGAALRDVFKHIAKGDEATVDECMKSTIAFGDDLNDAPMISSVGKGCIMQNCNPRLKEMCPTLEVIGSNAQNGAAKKLREVFKIADIPKNESG